MQHVWKKRLMILLVCLLIVSSGMGAYYQWVVRHRLPASSVAYPEPMLAESVPMHKFYLRDDTGDTFTNANLLGHWSILFFGFTHCSGVCPTTMAYLNRFWHEVKATHTLPVPTVVMISVDPQHDDVATMARYVHTFNANFIGLTGDEQQVQQLARELHIAYAPKYAGTASSDDLVHTNALLLVNPLGQLRAVFTAPFDSKKMLKDFSSITAQS